MLRYLGCILSDPLKWFDHTLEYTKRRGIFSWASASFALFWDTEDNLELDLETTLCPSLLDKIEVESFQLHFVYMCVCFIIRVLALNEKTYTKLK